MVTLYIGIDTHSKLQKAALVQTENFKSGKDNFENTIFLDIRNNINDYKELLKSIHIVETNPEKIIIGIDSSGLYALPITYFLYQHNYQVFFMDGQLSKATRSYLFGLENKSDKLDALRIAYLLYLNDLSGSLFRSTTLRSPHFESKSSILRTLISNRRAYTKLVTQSTNRLHGFLSAIFPEAEEKFFTKLLKILPYYPTPQSISHSHNLKKVHGIGTKDREDIKKLAKITIGIPSKGYTDIILNLCHHRAQALEWEKVVSDMIKVEIDNHPYGPILLSFPHLGYITAAAIISVVGNIDRWPSDKQLKKAFGLYAARYQSGRSNNISKPGVRGDRLCKATLHQVVIGCLGSKVPDNDFRDYYHKKISRGKRKISAIVSTMGKLTEIIYQCLKAGQQYEYKGIYTQKGKDIDINKQSLIHG